MVVDGYVRCAKCISGFRLVNNRFCVAINCQDFDPNTRACEKCPVLWNLAPTYYHNNKLTYYCIPYFCRSYFAGELGCNVDQDFYDGGHTVGTGMMIQFRYCNQLNSEGTDCLSCRNYRYPTTLTPRALCYPYHCINRTEFNCKRCEPGYKVSQIYEGSCVADEPCLEWNPTDGSCIRCPPSYQITP